MRSSMSGMQRRRSQPRPVHEITASRGLDLKEHNAIVRRMERTDERPQIPPILINTLPKSASVYIANTLAQGLGCTVRSLSNGYFPRDYVDVRRLSAFCKTGGVAQEHLDASVVNLRILASYVRQLVVHIRDPRQATLSWAHHLLRLYRERQELLLVTVDPALPDDYFNWDFQRQLDWQIQYHLPACIDWIQAWLHAEYGNNPLQIMFTSFEDFLANQKTFFAKILKFFGISTSGFKHVELNKSSAVNFRRGEQAEWKRVFTPAQIRLANEKIPIPMVARFRWDY